MAEYYVDGDNGSDLANGQTFATAKETFAAGAALLTNPGDNLHVAEKSGGYNESISVGVNGASGNRITIKNYQVETPVINGDPNLRYVLSASGDYVTFDGFTTWHTDPLPVVNTNADVTQQISLSGGWCEASNCSGTNPRDFLDEWQNRSTNGATECIRVTGDDAKIMGCSYTGASAPRSVVSHSQTSKRTYIKDTFVGECRDTNVRPADGLNTDEDKGLLIEHCHLDAPWNEDNFQSQGAGPSFAGHQGYNFRLTLLSGSTGEQSLDLKSNTRLLCEKCVVYGHPSDDTGPINGFVSNGSGFITYGSGGASQGYQHIIVRHNLVFRNNGAIKGTQSLRLYNNMFVRNDKRSGAGADDQAVIRKKDSWVNASCKNNLVYEHRGQDGGDSIVFIMNNDSKMDSDWNHLYTTDGDGLQFRESRDASIINLAAFQALNNDENSTTTDPQIINIPAAGAMADGNPFVPAKNYNLAVEDTSPVYQDSKPLTKVSGPVSLSNVIPVDNAMDFHDMFSMDGTGVIPLRQDAVYIDTTSEARHITAINYTSNPPTITIDGAPVTLAGGEDIYQHPYASMTKGLKEYHRYINWDEGVDEFGNLHHPATDLYDFAGAGGGTTPIVSSVSAAFYDNQTGIHILGSVFGTTENTVTITENSDGTGNSGTLAKGGGWAWTDTDIGPYTFTLNTLSAGDTAYVRVTHDNGNVSAPFPVTIIAVPASSAVFESISPFEDCTPSTGSTWEKYTTGASVPSGAEGVMLRARSINGINATDSVAIGASPLASPSADEILGLQDNNQTYIYSGVDASGDFYTYSDDLANGKLELLAYFATGTWTFEDPPVDLGATIDGAEHTDDITTETSSGGATAAIFRVRVPGSFNPNMYIVEATSTDARYKEITDDCYFIIKLDSSEQFKYKIQNDGGSHAIDLIAWTTDEAFALDINATAKPCASAGAYEVVDTLPAGKSHGIYEINAVTQQNQQWNMRTEGSSDDHYYDQLKDRGPIIIIEGHATTREIEAKVEHVNIIPYRVGTIDAGASGGTNPTVVGRTLDSVNKNADKVTYTLATVFLDSIDPDGSGLAIGTLTSQVGGTWFENVTSGNLEFTPTIGFSGPATCVIQGVDGAAATDSDTFTIPVVNREPIVNPPFITAVSGVTVNFTASASELDGDSVTWSIDSQPDQGTLNLLNAATGAFSYDAPAGMPPVVTGAVLRATDNDSTPLAGTANASFQLILITFESNIFRSQIFKTGTII